MGTNATAMPAYQTASAVGLVFGEHFWLVKAPSSDQTLPDLQRAVTEIVFEETVAPNVHVRGRLDGLFELELAGLPNCNFIRLPAVLLRSGEVLPDSFQRAQQDVYDSILSRLKYGNAFKACVTSAMLHVQSHAIGIDPPETPAEYIPLSGGNILDGRITFQKHARLDKKLKAIDEILANGRVDQFNNRPIIRYETIQFAVNQFKQIAAKGEEFASLIDLLYHQHHLFSNHRFSECLIGAWAIIETALHQQWKVFLQSCNEAGNPVTGDRKRKLTGRDFTASIIQETLSLAGKLPKDRYGDIDEVRKARNGWIHDLRPVQSETATRALQLCRQMIASTWGLDLSLCIGHGYVL